MSIETSSRKKKRGRRNRGRVFIIGAGVSASCGIAVANQLLRESVLRLEETDSVSADRIHRLLRYLFPSFEICLRNYPNIEDFLNLLQMAKRFNSEEFIESTYWSSPRLEDVSRDTLKAVTDYLWDSMGNTKRQDTIREFVRGTLRDGDTIITFNWDLTIERALEEYADESGFLYTYSRKRKTKRISLLKPHGSIDWFKRKAVAGHIPESQLGILDSELAYYPRFNRADTPTLAQIQPVIVPPVASKKFEVDFFKRTWRFAYRAVSDATELYIIGYSLPREDQFARFVFRRAIRNNIRRASLMGQAPAKVTVVNPDPATEGVFSRLVGREVKSFDFRQTYFEDYVSALQN